MAARPDARDPQQFLRARLGIGYGAESLGQLVELCGPAVTKELMFTARRYTAAEALRIGLVNQVVQANMLEDFVHSYAATMVDNAPLSIVAAKRIIDDSTEDEFGIWMRCILD